MCNLLNLRMAGRISSFYSSLFLILLVLLVYTPLALADLNDSLVACWSMEETSGNRSDSAGPNTVADYNTVGTAVGKVGNAANFVRANDEMLWIGDNPGLSTGDIDWTISAWVNFSSDPGADFFTIISKYDTTPTFPTNQAEFWLFYLPGTNQFGMHVYYNTTPTAVTVLSAGSYGSTGVWYLVTAWHDSTLNQIGIQVNLDAPVIQSMGVNVPLDTTGYIRIGNDINAGATGNMDGLIDELRFWKRVLSPTERSDLYNGGSGVVCPTQTPKVDTAWAMWSMDEASGTRKDSFGPFDLTDNNTVTSVAGQAGMGNAADFERDNGEYLSVADHFGLSTGDIDYTISCWVQIESDPGVGTWMPIITRYDSSAQCEFYLMWWRDTQRFQMAVYQTTPSFSQLVVTDNTVAAAPGANWYFVVAWHDSVTDTAYIQVNNNTPVSISVASLTRSDSTASTRIGGAVGAITPGTTMDGRIDQVNFYKKVLSPAERTALYNSGAGVTVPTPRPLNQNLVSCWTLDELANNATRMDSWASNHLTTTPPVPGVAGKLGNAADFENTDNTQVQQIYIDDNPDVSCGFNDYTIACWVNRETDPANYVPIITKNNNVSTSEFFLFRNNVDNNFYFRIYPGDGFKFTDAMVPSGAAGAWHFLVAWYDSSKRIIGLQVDGGTTTITSAGFSYPVNTAARLRLGTDYLTGVGTTTSRLDGQIDQFSMWKRVLTADERRALYNSSTGTPCAPDMPVQEWDLY